MRQREAQKTYNVLPVTFKRRESKGGREKDRDTERLRKRERERQTDSSMHGQDDG